uniref:DUF1308 domain-containing protein n=1 Tax=Clastoptera arizonana TaxID=38151 RepID=A0A1B6C4V1_9HEMI
MLDMECDLYIQFQNKITSGNNLLIQISTQFNVSGAEKLKKKIKQEIVFLTKVINSGSIKKEYLHCSNLHHFEALVICAALESDCTSLLETLTVQLDNGSCKKICIDIVSQHGNKWTKVIARNAAALSRISRGDSDFGQKTILDQATEYILCSHQHPHYFKPPKVVFHFALGISCWLAEKLERLGIIVTGEQLEDNFVHIEVDDRSSASSEEIIPPSANLPTTNFKCEVDKLNLDITTLIAYVSALTNGGANFKFDDPLLDQQAMWEREGPVKPQLDELFQGKEIYCCQTAAEDFSTILENLGGPGEKERAEKLMKRISIIPDIPFSRLKIGGKIKARSVSIFGTGNSIKALTVTANEGFVRAAKNQGIEFAVFVHQSRALTEAKQNSATSL